MELNSIFIDDFTKRWSTVFVALIGFLSFLFAVYGTIIGLIHEPNMIVKIHNSIFSSLLVITLLYSLSFSPIYSIFVYFLSYNAVMFLRMNDLKSLKIILLIFIILFLMLYAFFIPYGGWLDYFAFIAIVGFPIIIIDITFYFLLLIAESIKHWRIPNKITKNKYYKFCTLFFFFYLPICCAITVLLLK